MRTLPIGHAGERWSPKIAPDNPEDLPKYLFEELQSLSDHLIQSNKLHLERAHKNIDSRDPSYVGPSKPSDGDIIYADKDVVGATPGLYYYRKDDGDNGEWVLIA